MIGFDETDAGEQGKGKRAMVGLARSMSGAGGAIPIGFGGLKATELAGLMNRYREAALHAAADAD